MLFLKRVLDRDKSAAPDLVDVWRQRKLRSRPPRSATSIDNLPSQSVLIVVAHPDDEVIAAGALLARVPRVGVICVTDGAPRRGEYAREAGFSNWLDYANVRRREAETALALHGREIAPMLNLGIADQEAVFELVDTARYLVNQFRSGFSHVITHAYEGGHPDHDATAFCVHAACLLIAKNGATPPAIIEAPLYSAPDGTLVFSKFVPNADAGPPISLRLSPAEKDIKRRMFDCHVTQKKVFAGFGLDEETFRLAPRYHFSVSPHSGDVGYNQFKWPVTGRIWRAHAMRAMRALDLLEEME